jgi:hypothetical protein
MPTPEIAGWFRNTLEAALGDLTSHQRRQQLSLTKRRAELANMQDRLLNAYLAGSIDEPTKAKGDDLKAQLVTVDESLDSWKKTSSKRMPKRPCSCSHTSRRPGYWRDRLPND